MFRAQQNAFDDLVAKATDENLTSENWEFILDVCDKVAGEESGAKDAVAAMIKRLAHRNANVQLYTLELANALSQNCGDKVHRELASKSFTDALLRLAGDRNTHQQVKTKILEHMEEWTEMFSSNADFGIMEQAYMKLKSQNPTLHAPSKPTKQQITDYDRQKEEEELQMALALSIKDKPPAPQASGSGQARVGAAPSGAEAQSTEPSQPLPSGTTAATVSRVRALYDFQPSEPGELQFRKGDVIAVLESVYKDWWKGSLRGQTGIFPLNYVEKLSDPTQEELQREAQMEAEVFAQIKNVEKLLTLLSTSSSDLNVQENEEITTLYHSTLAIRPKLIELIGKYSQKKELDDFTQLNEKFIKARRDYEALLEASMAHPAQPQYGRPVQPAYGYPAPAGHPPYPQGPPGGHDPQRYFSPQPQEQAQTPAPSGPGRFYATEQGQQQHQQQQQLPYPASSHSPNMRKPTPTGVPPTQQPQQPPPEPYSTPGPAPHQTQNTYDHPQELGTSVYDSPNESAPPNPRHSYHPPAQAPQHQQQPPYPQGPAQQGTDYSPSVYSPEDSKPVGQGQQQPNPPYPTTQQPQQLPHHPAPGQAQYQQQPVHQPPYPPSAPGGGPYQPYQPPAAPPAGSQGVNANPASFYEQGGGLRG
ncbi:hypothetical protein AJ80_09085 [Polytolypa hystricis UAMH7299]|uniref:Class E vacuolar protein-sorting machinery protein HSE1 n=1 Tax=Polytolypa hystricis (strain UAMH7299) TaxID=1447883 RepID=A0A2B7WWN8_POLH7|nr:hypothetical protein AJ80_09085 [Polytolypa hystricis UAMH7299]